MTTDAPSGQAAAAEAEHITTSTRDPGEMRVRFEQWLRVTLPEGNDAEVIELTSPASNGMSSETLLVTARWCEDTGTVERRLVARVEPPATDYPVFTTYDLDMQFQVMRLVSAHTDVPVPRTHWYEPDPSVLGGAFFVMDQVDGMVPPDVLPYTFGDNWVHDGTEEARRTIQESAIRAAAGIHSITPDRHDLSFLQFDQPGSTALERNLNQWKAYKEWVVQDDRSPLLDECFDWLTANMPTDVSADALSWGDGRIGNMMFRDNEVVAVLDWEMAGVAPPEVDLGWMCYLHLFFQDLAVQLGVPGLPDMFRPVDVRAAYTAASGHPIGDLTWHIAYAAMRHGAIMRRVTERSIFFGEVERPADIDDLIMHRATLVGMLDGTYWEGVAL
ncbi:MAG: phosphotransferase family protein [Acidimicrobiales bacterium]|jgi:aminoglycoside phosphotransferase (APT) family kinase protein